MIWIQFVACTALLVAAAGMLSRYGDVLAEKTGLGRTWMGAVVLAGATSLPELVSGTSAIVLLDAPNLAVGSIFGSCLFNLALIAVMDLVYQPGRILTKVEDGHLLSAGLGVLVVSLASASILLGPTLNGPPLMNIGLTSLILIGLYLAGMRLIFRFEQQRQVEFAADRAEKLDYAHIPTWRANLIFGASVLMVFGLGVWLSSIADQIATTTGLARSFVGNLFLAVATSLPEVVVCLAAVRLGALDLAVGNVLGSNLFNIAILAVYDVAYRRGNLWASLPPVHALAGLFVVTMTGVVVVSLIYRASPKTPYRFSWDGAALLVMYGLAMFVLFQLAGAAA